MTVIGEHEAVGQARQRVVQRLIADRTLGAAAGGCGCKHVRDRHDEVDVLLRKAAGRPAPGTEHAGGRVLTGDRDLDHAHGLRACPEVRYLETGFAG